MALLREDSCKHLMNGAFFDRCFRLYTGYHGSKAVTFEVCVLSSDMPTGNQEHPTDDEIVPVSDGFAIARYNQWVAGLPNEDSIEVNTGQGGVVVP